MANSEGVHLYYKLSDDFDVIEYLSEVGEEITVEFFHRSKKETMQAMIRKMGQELEERERWLKTAANELEDDLGNLAMTRVISKMSTSEWEENIDIVLVVSDPLIR